MGARLALLALVFLGDVAQAQPIVGESDPWVEYHRAFSALASGRADEARVILRGLMHGSNETASRAARVVGLLERPALAEEQGAERRTRGARAELILFQTLHGVAVGAEICFLAECDGARPRALAMLLGTGAGLGLSFLATSGGITNGQTQAIDSGVLWGAWNAVAFMGALDAGGGDVAVARNLLIGQGAGLGAGVLIATGLHPTEGEVSVATTLSTWATIITLFGHGVAETDDTQAIWTTLLVASDASLLAGGFLGRRYPMSRGRTLLIDAGGILGMLAGALIPAVSQPDSGAAVFIPIILGTGGGLALGTYVTRDWDEREPPRVAPTVGVRVTPTRGGALAGIGGTW